MGIHMVIELPDQRSVLLYDTLLDDLEDDVTPIADEAVELVDKAVDVDDVDDDLAGITKLRSHGRRQAKAHGAQAAAGDHLPRVAPAVHSPAVIEGDRPNDHRG